MRIVAFITDPQVMDRILDQTGEGNAKPGHWSHHSDYNRAQQGSHYWVALTPGPSPAFGRLTLTPGPSPTSGRGGRRNG